MPNGSAHDDNDITQYLFCAQIEHSENLFEMNAHAHAHDRTNTKKKKK